jgi:hypothetical protein
MHTPDQASSSAASPAAATAQALFEREHLPQPPVPASLVAQLRPRGPNLFATRELRTSPYDISHYLAELQTTPTLPDYAVVGFDGYGTNSWAMHCYVVSGAVALFIQLPWGGAYTAADEARADIADIFDWAARTQAKMQVACQQGKMPPGWRLQVAASRIGRAGWRWLSPDRDNAGTPWNAPAGMKARLHQLLDDIALGNAVPE